ncbi:hypothetical protein BMF94_5948 [Rhodotorula taiwanensis]|uniref:GAR domain-containing protein n=1 Tax=Rhodotorula taiwanensis TaxID=741276 RepID=A0A2S5B2L1_9BASI|nr:hypothetical protein BMF94_5948 [Rhodotorula taiwanensis]
MAQGALAGSEVLELTSFVEKKAWIDDRIQFLSTQSPVDVASPLPPATAAISKGELEAWWTEHDRIEKEVEAYDMGDLARMRAFAHKSKQALSPRDTDLIEITLSTIFAIDKLLHLLRHRRRSLALLRFRLQWESALELAWSRHKRIVEVDLPTLLGYIRDAGTVDSLASEVASSLSRSVSLSASTSSRSLSASTSSRDLSASGGSSRNRDQLIALARSTLETDIRTLTNSIVPAAAAALDELIDATPSPLPSPFLDEQDRLESATSALNGLDRFVDDLLRQSIAAEGIRASVATSSQDAADLTKDASVVTSAGVVDQAILQGLTARLATLDERLDDIQSDLRQLPRPRHPAIPEQVEANADLAERLTILHQTVAASRNLAQEAVSAYERRFDVTSEVLAVLEDIRSRAARLRRFLGAQSDVSIDEAGSGEQLSDRAHLRNASPPHAVTRGNFAGVEDDIEAAARAASTVIRLVNRARDAGVSTELVQTLKQASADLAAQSQHAASALDVVRTRQDDADRRAERTCALQSAHQRLDDVSSELEAELERALWASGASKEAGHNPSHKACSLPDIDVLLPATSFGFSADDDEVLAATQVALDRLHAHRDLVDRARQQSAAIDDVLREMDGIRSRLWTPASTSPDDLSSLEKRFSRLRDDLHTRVPFLAGDPTESTFREVNLEAHDARVREHLNESTAVLAASLAQRLAEAETRVAGGRDATSAFDIFSPVPAEMTAALDASAGDDEERTLGLLERLDTLMTTRWLAPETAQLPQSSDVLVFEGRVKACRAAFDSVYPLEHVDDFQWVDPRTTRQRLETAETIVVRLRPLAEFANELSRTDAALSDLLVHVDDIAVDGRSSKRTTCEPSDVAALTAHALVNLRRASETCAEDRRVQVALQRVETTYHSLLDMLSHMGRPNSSLSSHSGRSSRSLQHTERASSAASIRHAISPRADDSLRPRSEATSERSARAAVSEEEVPGLPPGGEFRTPRANRARTSAATSTTVTPFSFDTPGHRTDRHLAGSRTRTPAARLFHDVARDRLVTPRPESRRPNASPPQLSLSSRSARKSSVRTPLNPSKARRQSLRHASSSTLQAAVSAVMQQLPFVSIEVADGRLTEESGVYLIGGRTCFLRLLASKQVMVRVGGGWLELSQFIITHFNKDDVLTVSPSRNLQLSHSAGQSPGTDRLGLSLSASLRSIDEYLRTAEVSPARRTNVPDSSSKARRRPVVRSPDVVSEPDNGTLRKSTLARSTDGRKPRPKLPVWRP